jgi:hypothetical protein
MVSQSLQKHGSDIVYLQKKPCIRKHLITKANRSLVDCLCECADNILRGNPNNPPFCKIAFFFLRETDSLVSALNRPYFS